MNIELEQSWIFRCAQIIAASYPRDTSNPLFCPHIVRKSIVTCKIGRILILFTFSEFLSTNRVPNFVPGYLFKRTKLGTEPFL